MSFFWSWNTASTESCLIISCSINDCMKKLRSEFISSLFVASSTSTRVEFATEISSQKICYLILTRHWKLLILVSVIYMSPTPCSRRPVVHHVMLHPKWLQAKNILAWKVTFGVVVLFFTRWFVVFFLLKIQKLQICIKRLWLETIRSLNFCPQIAAISFQRFFKLIQMLDTQSKK